MIDKLFLPIQNIFNIKQETISAFHRLEIYNVRDLIFYKPKAYNLKNINPNLSQLKEGQIIQTEIIIDEIIKPNSKNKPLKIWVSNQTGALCLVFFRQIPQFIINKLIIGTKHYISGKVQIFDNYYQISHPEFIFQRSMMNEIEPLYPLTYGLINRQLIGYITKAISLLEHDLIINLSQYDDYQSLYLQQIIQNIKIIHLYQINCDPQNIGQIWQDAIKILAQKELLANQIALRQLRQQKKNVIGRAFQTADKLKQIVLNNLGFELTTAQQQSIAEIENDQTKPLQMMRLLQGDVGSGKTLVALMTMLNTKFSGIQSVLMAPTDLLAQQHYQFFLRALMGLNVRVEVLTGKVTTKERNRILYELENGVLDILIGTHALFQEKVNWKNLGYVVIDEQHRFGVEQRFALINKGTYPDILIMTATPIPRSLTLTMFGDIDISKLDSKPKNRLPIITKIINSNKKQEIIDKLTKRFASGEKSYWVCPLIEEQNTEDPSEENTVLTNVNTRFLELNSIFPNKVGILHGKMSAEQKDSVLENFKNGLLQLVVATTVIEVGIDVPDATLIIIENADQFGLAQLHQLRGRVGRGTKQSYCLLVYNNQTISKLGLERLKIMSSSNDGFFIAEKDLILRGSGEIIGTKQSGEARFFFANLSNNLDLLTSAQKQAQNISIVNDNNSFIDMQIKIFSKNDNMLQ